MSTKQFHVKFLCQILQLIILSTTILLGNQVSASNQTILSLEKADNSIIVSITINNDTDFAMQALNHGWTGNGSAISPFIIHQYSFDNLAYNSPLIHILNTQSYFTLQNITINGGTYGVLFENVSNANVNNVTITNPVNNNIYLSNCENVTIFDSFISDSGKLKDAILIDYSKNITIKHSVVSDSQFGGIKLRDSQSSFLLSNTIKDNKNTGVSLGHTEAITLMNNIIKGNKYRGISIEGNSLNTTLENNLIQNNVESGVYLGGINTSIMKNTFYNNTNWGLRVDPLSTNTSVTENNFIENYLTSSYPQQVSDISLSSTYNLNFFDDATGPDNDNNGIVDMDYQISKFEDVNFDYNSKTTVYPTTMIHIVTRPNGITIAGNSPFSGSVNVVWNKSSDTFSHEIMYSIYYSDNGGSSWVSLVENLTSTTYQLDTNKLQDNKSYLLRVQAFDSFEKSNYDISENSFTVQNQITSTSIEQTTTTNFEFLIFGLGALILIAISKLHRKRN